MIEMSRKESKSRKIHNLLFVDSWSRCDDSKRLNNDVDKLKKLKEIRNKIKCVKWR